MRVLGHERLVGGGLIQTEWRVRFDGADGGGGGRGGVAARALLAGELERGACPTGKRSGTETVCGGALLFVPRTPCVMMTGALNAFLTPWPPCMRGAAPSVAPEAVSFS